VLCVSEACALFPGVRRNVGNHLMATGLEHTNFQKIRLYFHGLYPSMYSHMRGFLSLSLSVALEPLLQFLNPIHSPWKEDQPVARTLPAHRTTQTQTSMPRVGLELTIPVFERAKAVHALYRVATVIGM
jgi:hypothetical protein